LQIKAMPKVSSLTAKSLISRTATRDSRGRSFSNSSRVFEVPALERRRQA
jgi:hypothetical protein